ncbi:hypothetical protein [Phascolarctobacterium faecium]|uniref:hypothetical protein n=1 Tax=Phascolarctobacterium faecium TaxID=33025 RepID=UPI002062E6AA|nr:MAG TPA: hypothetical protein [Caudoviricetes sp.]
MKKNRFNFDKKMLEMLDNLDLIPKTQTDPLPGVGGRLFIITRSQQKYFTLICDTLALVSEEETNTYSKKEKLFWSCIWNNAERVLSNCVVYERK